MSEDIQIDREDVAGMRRDKGMAKWRMIPYRDGSRDGQKLWTDVTRPSIIMETTTRLRDSHITKRELYDIISLADESIVAVLRE